MIKLSHWNLWLRWVLANAFGEMFGLGLTFAAGIGLFVGLEPQTFLQALLMIFLMTATGILEGTILGLAQWAVLRRAIPAISRKTWVVATLAGALIAWFLGSLPSTWMGLQVEAAPAASPAPGEPSPALMAVMAAGMGLVLGSVLALPQWLVLRKHVRQAAWWFLANSAGWAAGMPIVFAAVGWAYDAGVVWQGILILAFALWVTGAVVGSIHGIALVRLVRTCKINNI